MSIKDINDKDINESVNIGLQNSIDDVHIKDSEFHSIRVRMTKWVH